MHIGHLLMLLGGAWILQYVFTWLQLQHYRRTMRTLVTEYRGRTDYYMFSGVCRKAMGRGAIVIAIIDSNQVILRCEALCGVSVFAKFSPLDGYAGRSLSDVGKETDEVLQRKRGVSSQQKSLAKALQMIVLNAERSAKEKMRTVDRKIRPRRAI